MKPGAGTGNGGRVSDREGVCGRFCNKASRGGSGRISRLSSRLSAVSITLTRL